MDSKRKLVQFPLRLSELEINLIKNIANQQGETINRTIRRAIKQYLSYFSNQLQVWDPKHISYRDSDWRSQFLPSAEKLDGRAIILFPLRISELEKKYLRKLAELRKDSVNSTIRKAVRVHLYYYRCERSLLSGCIGPEYDVIRENCARFYNEVEQVYDAYDWYSEDGDFDQAMWLWD